jgi:hypothetical protein
MRFANSRRALDSSVVVAVMACPRGQPSSSAIHEFTNLPMEPPSPVALQRIVQPAHVATF